MRANQAHFSVSRMCEILGVSRSGYYAWRERGPSARSQADGELTVRIRASHQHSRGTYGAPRIHEDLKDEGVRIGRKRIARLMRAAVLEGVSRRSRVRTTVRGDGSRPAPDLVQRRFSATGPDRLWVADITYVPTGSGFLYLAVVLDVWSRRIVGCRWPHICAPN